MNFNKYLKKIGIDSIPKADLESLFLLQKNHLLSIPFENLDIPLGKKIELDYEKVYKKIVNNNRGGFCHELNGLFFLLLKNIGFDVKRISAQVYIDENTFANPFGHMAIIAKIDKEEWLVDVGFGRFSFQPLKIILDKTQSDGNSFYKIIKYNHRFHAVMVKDKNDNWKCGYKFTKKHYEIEKFVSICNWQQVSPKSNFTNRKVITIPNKKGRITLTNKSLKITKGKKVVETKIKNELDFSKKLKKYFGLTLEFPKD